MTRFSALLLCISLVKAKKQCVGLTKTVEYDPAIEQCCGDGTVGYPVGNPLVCSVNMGCCPGGYTGYPQCFDNSTRKCCGYNFATDMPLVCGSDVDCPPNTYWRQCPAAAAAVETAASAATGAVASSADEAAAQTAASTATGAVASSADGAAAKVASLSNASVAMESAASVNAKKQCRGMQKTVDYDPALEQCCGEGKSFQPTVCSANLGCCPSGYTGYPQCFDTASQKCCGYNSASDMPLVCSADVDCPPNTYVSKCPVALAAAAVPIEVTYAAVEVPREESTETSAQPLFP